jgi:hypothetical protein
MSRYSCIDITFSGECAERYWPPERLASVPSKPKAPSIDKGIERVLGLLRTHAPHVAGSFACDESWWKTHWGSPEGHVSSMGIGVRFWPASRLTLFQMFKSLLMAGVMDILVIFNDARSISSTEARKLIESVNEQAGVVWRRRGSGGVTARLSYCRNFTSDAVRTVIASNSKDFRHETVPGSICERLDDVFAKHYGGPGGHLLIGRADDEAYAAQESYAVEVMNLLSSENDAWKARAAVRIGKVYGYTSLPLLSVSSIDGMWKACTSTFYKKQLSLVSSARPYIRNVSDFQASFIGGWSRFRSPLGTGAWAATMGHPSNDSSEPWKAGRTAF